MLVQVRETEAAMGKWVGFAIWDSGTPRVAQLAGKFGQQTRMVVTTDFQRKVNFHSFTDPTMHSNLRCSKVWIVESTGAGTCRTNDNTCPPPPLAFLLKLW